MDKDASFDRALRRMEIVLRQQRRARARRRALHAHAPYQVRGRRLVDREA